MSYQTQAQKQGAAPLSPDHAGFAHLEELARQLIRHLGVDGARRTCVDNRWNGVLAAIDRLR
ncbi:MAG: hypothetical protein Tsb0016_23730 [Sphingomonadales bacterium]